MRIPKQIEILGHTIKIRYKSNLKKCVGLWDPNTLTIYLQKSTEKEPLSKEYQEQTFLHEVVHAILDSLGYESLSMDEKFVDQFSSVLYQVIKSLNKRKSVE